MEKEDISIATFKNYIIIYIINDIYIYKAIQLKHRLIIKLTCSSELKRFFENFLQFSISKLIIFSQYHNLIF